MSRRRILVALALLAAWAVVAVPTAAWLFVHTSQATVLAGHEATLRPTYDGEATLHLGPFLPDVRHSSGGRIGADITLGRTDAATTEELVQRYAFIASNPRPQIGKAEEVVRDLALSAALRGAATGVVPVGVWLLLGAARRRQLLGQVRRPRVLVATAAGVAVLVVAMLQPWEADASADDGGRQWLPLDVAVPDVTIPAEARGIEVRADLTTHSTRKLLLSAIGSYQRSKAFYADAAEAARRLELHQPERGETVALLVSDRHDNIGMDSVARAIALQGDATAVLDAGDDTSTGSKWEEFSLDSLADAFTDFDRWAIAGNHDHGDFVSTYLEDAGWTHLTGTVVDGPGGSRILGIDDPRSSGLGAYRDEPGASFDDVRTKVADLACKADEDGDRANTLLVHDANLGRTALSRGCVDLVLAGHLHVQVGPTRVDGDNGAVGYRYTNGTTGGAAYAIAVGSKLRREAEMTLVTYAKGRPVGIQPVRLRTDGRFVVDPYVPLEVASGGGA